MNEQRSVIYRIRKDILSDSDNVGFINDMIEDVADSLVETYRPDRKVQVDAWPWADMVKGFQNTFNTEYEVNSEECYKKHDGSIEKYFETIGKELLAKNFSQYDDDQVRLATREILLTIFDQHWKDHLLSMDNVKEGLNLRAYAQKNPLTEYKRESFNLFENMRMEVKKTVVENIFRVKLYTPEEIEEIKRRQQEMLEKQLQAAKRAQQAAEQQEEAESAPVARRSQKVGRNDVCPCGSGKKFKHCHGA
jgi:preprotein translocase subunit SecA